MQSPQNSSRITNVIPAFKQQLMKMNSGTQEDFAKFLGVLSTVSNELKTNLGNNVSVARDIVYTKFFLTVLSLLKSIDEQLKKIDTDSLPELQQDSEQETKYMQILDDISSTLEELKQFLKQKPKLTNSTTTSHISNVNSEYTNLYSTLYEGFSLANTVTQQSIPLLKDSISRAINYIEGILKPPTTGGSVYKKSKLSIQYKSQKRCIYLGPRGGQYILVNKKYVSVKTLKKQDLH